MNSGFYKFDGNDLFYALNFVYNINYALEKDLHDTYIYPIDGWYWFDSYKDACIAFNLDVEKFRYVVPIFEEI